MLGVGCRLKVSASFTCRRFRRLSPRSRSANSSCAQLIRSIFSSKNQQLTAESSRCVQSDALEGFDPDGSHGEREIVPVPRMGDEMEVRAQSEVQLEEIHLLADDEAAAIRLLQERGIIPGDFDPARQALQPVPTTRV